MIGEGRVAVVTGGGRGIGRAIAVRLAGEGAQIAISYRSNDAAAQEAAEEVRGAGVRCELFKGDVAEPDDVKALFGGVTVAYGRVDILVNNAGVTRDNLMMRMKEAEFDEVLRTNLKGTYMCTRAAMRPMVRARWGRIVNVSSCRRARRERGQANYAASKAGIIGFTKSVAREVAQRGITANVVAPGYVETELTAVCRGDQGPDPGSGAHRAIRGAGRGGRGRGFSGWRGSRVRDRADARGGRRDDYAVAGQTFTLRAILERVRAD
jgi:3-oxoacyl-[acyl-carrier protein] reductase